MPRRNSNQRNHAARSPQMRKGGAHTQSKTAKRVRERLDLELEVEEWLEEDEGLGLISGHKGPVKL